MDSARLFIANSYGNVVVDSSLPEQYVHVSGKRLQPTCRRLGICFAPAVVGFEKKSKKYPARPVFDGVVIAKVSELELRAALAERERKYDPDKAAARRERDRQARAAEQARIDADMILRGISPSSRTAKWLQSGQISDPFARLISFKTRYRHRHTNYDELLDEPGFDRDDARAFLDEDPIPDNWTDYLAEYRFPFPEVAERLAAVLKEPRDAHPVWFAEACCAVHEYHDDKTPLDYEEVTDCISAFRDARLND